MNVIEKVRKRNGDLVDFDSRKIDLVIEYATEGLGLESEKLSENVTLFLHEGISTSDIQKLLINNSRSFVSTEEPNWKFVSSRLLLLDLYKRSKRTQGQDNFGYGNYLDFIKEAIRLGVYEDTILKAYTEDEISEISKEIVQEYDFGFDFGGMMMIYDRYLIKKNKDVFELPQQMYMTIALLAASREPRAKRLRVAKEFYHAIGDRFLSPATPILLNLRRPKGNLASCFIAAMGDGLREIYSCLDQAAQISKNGGGVGINISRVRSHGAYIRGVKGASSGVTGWIRLLNDTAVSVNQLGSRAGAITVALDVWHRDIFDFLDIQTENGDQRTKAYDIFPQLVVNNYFLEHYEKKMDWYLFDPHEVLTKYGIDLAELWGDEFKKSYDFLKMKASNGELELFSKVEPSKIMKKALQSAVETGLPYWSNKDTINEANPNKHVGMIGSVNLCVESFSNFGPSRVTGNLIKDEDGLYKSVVSTELGYTHCCNLLSINSSRIPNDKLEYYARLAVRFMDNLLDISTPPVPEAAIHNDDYRIIGIGTLGLHDFLVREGYSYEDGISVAEKYAERLAYYCIDESCNLARDRGRYKYFEGSDWEKGIFFGKSYKECISISKAGLDWESLAFKVSRFGMRNGGLLAIAPNTSTAVTLGCSASILPIYDRIFTEKNSIEASTLTAQFLSPETFWMYQPNKEIDQNIVTDMTSRIQAWTDQGISMELILNLDYIEDATELRDLYMNAMKKKCKTIYYLRSKTKKNENKSSRSGNRKSNKPSEKTECTSCAN